MSGAERPKRILAVDDEEFIRLLVAQILSRAGYQVDLAEDGGVALRKIEASRPDLVILDLMMPGVDGWSVLERLRGMAAPPPVLVLTAHGGYDSFTRLAREGVAAYMSKPFSLHELLSVCATILAKETPESASGQERRRAARRALMVEVKVVLSQQTGAVAVGELLNLSRTGAQVNLGVPLEPGDRVSVGFRFPGREPLLSLESRLEWRRPLDGGFAHGLVFVNLTSEHERRLGEVLGLAAT